MVKLDVISNCAEHKFRTLFGINFLDWNFWSGRNYDYIATGLQMVDKAIVSVVVDLEALFER